MSQRVGELLSSLIIDEKESVRVNDAGTAWEAFAPMDRSVYDSNNDGIVDKARMVSITVRNETGSTITKGSIVYVSGASGNHVLITLADKDAESTSSKTLGMVVADIANNGTGMVAVNGTVDDLNTNAYTAGTALYLGDNGGWTSTKPVAPAHMVFIGWVTIQSSSAGQIVLHIQNGYELDELHDVLISSPSNNQVLTYESSSGLWKNKAVSATVSDGDKGDIVVSSSGTVWTNETGDFIFEGLSTKQETSGHSMIISSVSDGYTASRYLSFNTGDSDAYITVSGAATLTGVNTGDQTITLTGAVTGSGTGSFATTLASGVDAAKIANGTVSNTEFQYLDGVTSAIQTQINAKFTLPSLTSGSVLFSDGTTIAQDNANLYWDDTNNRLALGTTAPQASLSVFDSSTALSSGVMVYKYGDDASQGRLTMRKSRGTIASPTAIANSDYIGQLAFGAYSGSQWLDSIARVMTIINGTVTTSSIPTDMTFYSGTTTGGFERMRLFSGGQFAIGTSTVNSAKLNVLSTTEQVRVNYDTSNYYSVTVGSSGSVTYDAVGSGAAFTFSDAVTANSGGTNTTYLTVGDGTCRTRIINKWLSSTGTWIDLSTDGPSGIGSGGAGANAWIAYVKSNTQYFSNSTAGDIIYRNTGGRLLFGTTADVAAQIALSSTALTFVSGMNIGFFGATAVAQPSTSTTAATRVSVAGNTVTDADTFDGYTIGKVVKALRNLGLLA